MARNINSVTTLRYLLFIRSVVTVVTRAWPGQRANTALAAWIAGAVGTGVTTVCINKRYSSVVALLYVPNVSVATTTKTPPPSWWRGW